MKMLGKKVYGCVFEAIDLRPGHRSSSRQASHARKDVPYMSIREIDILTLCDHPNIIGFKEFIIDVAFHSVFIVMNWAVIDLQTHLTSSLGGINEAMVKKLML